MQGQEKASSPFLDIKMAMLVLIACSFNAALGFFFFQIFRFVKFDLDLCLSWRMNTRSGGGFISLP